MGQLEALTRDAWRVILMACRAVGRWRSCARGWTNAPTCGYAVALRCLMFRLVASVEPSGKAQPCPIYVVPLSSCPPGSAELSVSEGPWKDHPWLPRAPRTRLCPLLSRLQAVSLSRRSANPLKCPTSWLCRRRASTGCWATNAGKRAWPKPWPQAVGMCRTCLLYTSDAADDL